MAVTKGHGNPNWTREEVILALELYFDSGGKVPGQTDKRVIELSRLLKSLPTHDNKPRGPSFRNEDGVAFKLQNIRQVATGRGLGNTSKIDQEVWNDLGHDPEQVRSIAAAIRSGAIALNTFDDSDEDIVFKEGRLLTLTHYKRERHRGVRKALLDYNLKRGGLRCEICGLSSTQLPEALKEAVFEAHHILPISQGVERKTQISDLALLCANCHRLIHRASAESRKWLTIEAMKTILSPIKALKGVIT